MNHFLTPEEDLALELIFKSLGESQLTASRMHGTLAVNISMSPSALLSLTSCVLT